MPRAVTDFYLSLMLEVIVTVLYSIDEMTAAAVSKPLVWVGSSQKNFRSFPDPAKSVMGCALFMAQLGERHRRAKTLSGFGGAGVMEFVDDHRGDTFRTVFTERSYWGGTTAHDLQNRP